LKNTFAKIFKGVQFTPLLNLAKTYFTDSIIENTLILLTLINQLHIIRTKIVNYWT